MPLVSLRSAVLFVFTVLTAAPLSACSTNYKIVKVKNYHLAITSGDTSLTNTFQSLVSDFNQAAGSNVLYFETNPANANCSIAVVPGLVDENADGLGTGKVGLGQWETQTNAPNNPLTMPGQTQTETVSYSMNVEFDLNYMTTSTTYQLQKLFYHEVGHGLERVHDMTNESDVMYPDVGVGDPKDFNSYFEYVRSYMAD